jgi:hypothetical protein
LYFCCSGSTYEYFLNLDFERKCLFFKKKYQAALEGISQEVCLQADPPFAVWVAVPIGLGLILLIALIGLSKKIHNVRNA